MTKHWFVFLAAVAVTVSGCTNRYQDMLRDRDGQIRDLNGEVSDLQLSKSELEQRERGAREELERLRAALAARPEGGGGSEADKVASQLPEGVDVRYNRGRLSIGIENTVTFTSGSSDLRPQAGTLLKRVADVLKRDYGNRRIYVEGHTDSDPIRKTKDKYRSNRHLSAERADVVADYLVSKGGIEQSHVVVVGFGPFDPKEAGAGDAAKARNRRVEIVVGEPM